MLPNEWYSGALGIFEEADRAVLSMEYFDLPKLLPPFKSKLVNRRYIDNG